MKIVQTNRIKYSLLIIVFIASLTNTQAQTDADAVMMEKNNFCIGAAYNYSSWKNYWEGTLKRNNQNLGVVSTKTVSVMGNYGISSKLNLFFNLPYIKTKATAGTLHGQKGLQDAALWLKWMPYEKKLGKGTLSLYGAGGISFPTTNYSADFLPLSIGLHSTNFTIRGIADYEVSNLFATVSASYVIRSNIKIDRATYYTTKMNYTNEVQMPNAAQFNIRLGYRSSKLIAEALVSNWTTLGGFDITRNNSPFASNKVNITTGGLNIKYNIKKIEGLSLIGGGMYTLAGRNIGQSTAANAGVFYIINLTKHTKKETNTTAK